MIAPVMKTEKNRAILVQNLSESRIPGMIIGGVQQGLIPFGTDLHIRNRDDWPRSFHSDVFIGLTRPKISHRWRERAFASNFYFQISPFYFSRLPAVGCIAWLGLCCSHKITLLHGETKFPLPESKYAVKKFESIPILVISIRD